MAPAVRLRILIVEDYKDSADSLQLMLDVCGYETHVVGDGEAAVRAAAALQPHVILMDIALPILDGYEAARQIRAQNPKMRPLIIATTAWEDVSDRQKSLTTVIDRHMVKPVNFVMLKEILDSFAIRVKSPSPST